MNRYFVAVCLVVAGMGSSTFAWWDTVATAVRPSPLLREIEAESIPGIAADRIVDDAQSNGGAGGKAVVLAPEGPPIALDVDVKPGLYSIFAISRRDDVPFSLGIVTLTVREHASNQTRSWTMPYVIKNSYYSSIMMYFPADFGGKYTLTLQLEKDIAKLHAENWAWHEKPDKVGVALLEKFKETKFAPILVDRLELHDVLGCLEPITQTKSKRMLTSDEELARLRKDFAADANATIKLGDSKQKFTLSNGPAWFASGRSASERAARNDELWNLLPDFNYPMTMTRNAWTTTMGHDNDSIMIDSANAYELTGNKEVAFDGALLLVAVAQKYPALDYFAQGVAPFSNIANGNGAFLLSVPSGKEVGRGWAGRSAVSLITTYDKLFDFMKDNKQFAAEVHRRIPTLNTPEDVVRYIDTRILRHIVDAAHRNMIEGNDAPKALAPLVLGPGPDSDRMLRNGIFTKIAMNLTHRGGIEDHAVCSFNRDGVHYIGSVSYLKDDLMEIGQILHQYSLSGGNSAFDILDANPHMGEAEKTLDQLRVGGGFKIIQGDGGDLRLLREKDNPGTDVSRILGGYGMSILESGVNQTNPLLKRGLDIYFGIGRGHSHQDTLRLEMVAHGARVVPDLGGRDEQKYRGWPNMRDNRVHNLVEVDDTNFCNPCPGSVTSGTGWNTGFVSNIGVQFLEHQARATSHPQVTRYARQTVMIDVPTPNTEGDDALTKSGNSYVFDVFRVAGGKTHTYVFNGCPTHEIAVNTPLSETLDEDAANYLRKHYKGSQRVGVAPNLLQADWPMDKELQERYQADQYDAKKRITTRMALFGAAGRNVLVGNAYSEMYKYNFPFLYIRARQEQDGLQSVFPVIIEPFAGEPFITEKQALAIKPAQSGADGAVALKIKTTGGTTDVLYASGHADTAVDLEGGAHVDGKFAMVSTDAKGLRAAQLVGGTTLKSQSIRIDVPTREYRATITATQYPARKFTVNAKLPTQLLAGQWCGMTNPSGLRHAFKLEKLSQQGNETTLTHEKMARYYQSTIMTRDEKDGSIECEIEAPVFNADPKFIDGTTVGNEYGDKTARVSIVESDRWMHLAWPGYRTSLPNTMSWADVPDANGDGKHMLKMFGKRDETQPGEEPAPVMLEVTRITDNGETFYFKIPNEEEYQRGGWPYNERRLVNETGTKTFRAIYPGSSYRWKLDPAAKLKVSDFTDADGDGKAKLIAYLYGPGDEMVLDTAVHIRRVSPGIFCVQSNTPCTITFTDATKKIAISSDKKTFTNHIVNFKSGQVSLVLSETDLGNGTIWLQLQP